MSRICKECPIAQLAETDMPKYEEGFQNGLFLQAIQGLSGQMVGLVRGTKAGLTDERIEEIRQEEVRSWGVGSEEAVYLDQNPELAKAVHDCELKVRLGECAIHSIQTKTTV